MISSKELASQLKSFNIDIPHMAAILAKQMFLAQTEDKKKLPLSRFFQNRNSLRLLCAQYIAAKIVKDEFPYNLRDIPSDLYQLIDDQLAQIQSGISNEEMLERINKQSKEQKNAFYSALFINKMG